MKLLFLIGLSLPAFILCQTLSDLTVHGELSPRSMPGTNIEKIEIDLSNKGLHDIGGLEQYIRVRIPGKGVVTLANIPADYRDKVRISLNLANNALTNLPVELGALPISHINLSHNQFKEIPEIVKRNNLVTNHLVQLDLSHNAILNVAPALSLNDKLTHLDLSHNQISQLPLIPWEPKHAKIVNLSHNRLTSIPPQFFSNFDCAIEFDLSHNNLTELPPEIGDTNDGGNAKDLVHLDLSHNNLQKLPETMGDLTNLKTINLAHNQLTSLPNNLTKLAYLEAMDLTENPVSKKENRKLINPALLTFLTDKGFLGGSRSSIPERRSIRQSAARPSSAIMSSSSSSSPSGSSTVLTSSSSDGLRKSSPTPTKK